MNGSIFANRDQDRITIAILALGGQGGGVLADWILDLAAANGYVAQGTSVPGVAQRTGSTVYYIELIRKGSELDNRPEPVMALMPVPGDVDIVVASELMEAGRAILRGFVTRERTTLIGSTHRIYAISEKSALGDGRAASERILNAAEKRSAHFVGFDMDAAATEAGSVISSIMFGALAGSGALPFPAEAFEDAIRSSGKAVTANLAGFAAGHDKAVNGIAEKAALAAPPEPTTQAGRELHARIIAEIPVPAQAMTLEGVKRLMDYQDAEYARLYFDRLSAVAAQDSADDGFVLTTLTARHLALWMAYDDTIRVADLKIRASRATRVRDEVRLAEDQLLAITEYMHPRLQEVCETLPAGLGRAILDSARWRGWLEPFFHKGRHVRVTSLRWFLVLRCLASLRYMRRRTLRYRDEHARIEAWLELVAMAAKSDRAFAAEIVQIQELLKGYGDTFERGLRNSALVLNAARESLGRPDAAARVRALREAALSDETGSALTTMLAIRQTAA